MDLSLSFKDTKRQGYPCVAQQILVCIDACMFAVCVNVCVKETKGSKVYGFVCFLWLSWDKSIENRVFFDFRVIISVC